MLFSLVVVKAGDGHAIPHAPRHRFLAWFPYPTFPEKGVPLALLPIFPLLQEDHHFTFFSQTFFILDTFFPFA